jgi:hypothetical protein
MRAPTTIRNVRRAESTDPIISYRANFSDCAVDDAGDLEALSVAYRRLAAKHSATERALHRIDVRHNSVSIPRRFNS